MVQLRLVIVVWSEELPGLRKWAKIRILCSGASYRFGGARFSFYGELVYESLRNFSDSGFSEEELFAAKYARDLDNGWLMFNEPIESISRFTMSYGGDFQAEQWYSAQLCTSN